MTKEEVELLYGALLAADWGVQMKREPLREAWELWERLNLEVQNG